MRSFQFKNKGAFLRIVEEPKIKKKAWTFDRILFVLLLVFIIFFLLRFAYKSLNVLEGHGQIVFEKLSITFPDDIKINGFYVTEGDEILLGDTLFSYFETEEDRLGVSIQQLQVRNTVEKENLALERQMVELKMKKIGEEKFLSSKLQLLKHKQNMILLETENHAVLDRISSEILRSQSLIQQIELEILTLRKMKDAYKSMENSMVFSLGRQNRLHHYIATMGGISGTINFRPNEICYRQQEAIAIHNPQQVKIRAYFPQKYAESLWEGTVVYIQFADGTFSKGRISHSYIATYALPSEFQKKYEPTERNILVDIIPIDKEDESLWRKFYLMDVNINIHRLNPFL